MFFPTTVADNFFSNPYKVVKYANTCEYGYSPDGRWPGQRTRYIHTLNQDLFVHTCYKILSILYPTNYLSLDFRAKQHFQKINLNDYDNGWIHNDGVDNNLFTAIIYLSEHDDCGTSLYHLKKDSFEALHSNELSQRDFYLNVKDRKKREEDKRRCKINNDPYEETIRVNSKLNRVVMFDANHYHAAHDFHLSKLKKQERLTLITFFNELKTKDGKRIYFPLDPNRNHY